MVGTSGQTLLQVLGICLMAWCVDSVKELTKQSEMTKEKAPRISILQQRESNLQELKRVVPHVMPGTSQQIKTPEVSILHEEIKNYDNLLAESILISDNYEKASKLYRVKKLLEILCDKLYEESQLSRKIPIEELEYAIDVLDMDYVLLNRESVENQRVISVLDKIKNKESTGRDEGRSQNVVETSEMLFEEVARQRAYIEAIKQVKDLQDECNYAIKHAYPDNFKLPAVF